MPEDAARAAIERLAPLLADGAPAFKKIDSLLRGHVAVELAACLRWFDHCVLAPAFPFQGRITRGGRQLVRSGDGWRDSGVDLAAALRALGITVQVRDAETDADLDAIVAQGRTLTGRVLWCGTGGLAGALAGRRPIPCPALPRPVLALIGSDHPVSEAQMAAVPAATRGSVVVCELPAGIERNTARDLIGLRFATVLRERTQRPGTLFVTGGETLRELCRTLGASHLELDGEIEPGVPTSVLRGGAWDGQRIVRRSRCVRRCWVPGAADWASDPWGRSWRADRAGDCRASLAMTVAGIVPGIGTEDAMRLGVMLPLGDIGGEPNVLRDFSLAAEEMGYTNLGLPDHVLGANVATHPEVVGRNTSADLFHDPFVAFGFLAGLCRESDGVLHPGADPGATAGGPRGEAGGKPGCAVMVGGSDWASAWAGTRWNSSA